MPNTEYFFQNIINIVYGVFGSLKYRLIFINSVLIFRNLTVTLFLCVLKGFAVFLDFGLQAIDFAIITPPYDRKGS